LLGAAADTTFHAIAHLQVHQAVCLDHPLAVLIFLKGFRSSKRLTHGSNVNFSELNFASFKYLATRVQKIQRKIGLENPIVIKYNQFVQQGNNSQIY
jgi:hypothetical protein